MLAVATRECTLMVITCCNIRCNQACRPCLCSFLPTTWTREKKPPYANHTLPFRHHYSWNTQWCKCRALFNYLFINAPVLHFPRSKGPRNGKLIIISCLCLAKIVMYCMSSITLKVHHDETISWSIYCSHVCTLQPTLYMTHFYDYARCM